MNNIRDLEFDMIDIRDLEFDMTFFEIDHIFYKVAYMAACMTATEGL